MITCMIVDDERLAIDVLRRYIESLPGIELRSTFENPVEAFSELQQQPCDVLFLDIQMPGLTGLELIRSLRHPPLVVITTAYREFAAEGFDLEVFDYLVKPVSRERFLKTVSRIHEAIKEKASPEAGSAFIFVKIDKKMVKVRFDDIQFIEGLKNYVKIKTGGKDLIAYHTLSYMMEKLPAAAFMRIHKSFIVNMNKIERFTSDAVEIQNFVVPVGKTYREELDEVLRRRMV